MARKCSEGHARRDLDCKECRTNRQLDEIDKRQEDRHAALEFADYKRKPGQGASLQVHEVGYNNRKSRRPHVGMRGDFDRKTRGAAATRRHLYEYAAAVRSGEMGQQEEEERD